ncbi:MAG: hypothetical protein A4E28_00037 [Methanocella sp. PtaU1.Bin125]|nr:MAG: hypothetical protein A4E28_00037 [Methanocella sp. PtaU1.Bin125]
MMDRPKFLVDRMLGRLVAWLRIFDYDTKSALELGLDGDEDAGLVDLARREGRVLLTRDRALVDRAVRACAAAVLIQPDDVREQLCELVRHYPLETVPVMERCTACNALLRKAAAADSERIRLEAPSHIVKEDKEFWVCDRCGKVYWQGSHWRNIKMMSDELNRCRPK